MYEHITSLRLTLPREDEEYRAILWFSQFTLSKMWAIKHSFTFYKFRQWNLFELVHKGQMICAVCSWLEFHSVSHSSLLLSGTCAQSPLNTVMALLTLWHKFTRSAWMLSAEMLSQLRNALYWSVDASHPESLASMVNSMKLTQRGFGVSLVN